MDGFEVIRPGPLTTIQDLGRYGYQQYGIPPSGAMDNYACRVSNLLVGNDENAACLEITLFGLRLRALNDTVIAVSGGDQGATLNCNPIPLWQAITVRRGDMITFLRYKSGCRSYLAVAGGINKVPSIMGSASTNIRTGIGGLDGRALQAGDLIQFKESSIATVLRKIPPEYIPAYREHIELRVMLGPQDDRFTEEGIHTFLTSEYSVSHQADRMGYRLTGPRIQHKKGADIVYDGIPLGAIQVPGDGSPIILLADRPTTGGYTKIAVVISADISCLAQTKPGDTIRFRQVSENQALGALKEYEQKLERIGYLLQERNT